jgi:fructan beta-fructosidase
MSGMTIKSCRVVILLEASGMSFKPSMTRLRYFRAPILGLVCAFCAGTVRAAEDLVIADFERNDFGGWNATGDAFGQAPAGGAIDGQMAVEGFSGKGFINSFHGSDETSGTLSSPPFKIERKHLNFLIGGGGFSGETCLNLKSQGKVVRTATGPNKLPGGSERLNWESWDVSDLMGKTVSLEAVDSRKGTWGHLNVDQIVQSDTPATLEIKQQFTVNQRYLIWPVSLDTKLKKRFFMTLDGEDKPFTYYDICLTNKPDFWVFTDLANFQGRKITV